MKTGGRYESKVKQSSYVPIAEAPDQFASACP